MSYVVNIKRLDKKKTSNLKVGLGRKEEGRRERIERKKTGKKTKRSTKKQKESKLSHIVIRGLEHRGGICINKKVIRSSY